MQEAVPVGVGAMAAILGLSINDIKSLIDDVKVKGVCEIANDNEPNQIVISGNKQAIIKVCENAKLLGAKRAILLPVSAPFHSSQLLSGDYCPQDQLYRTHPLLNHQVLGSKIHHVHHSAIHQSIQSHLAHACL